MAGQRLSSRRWMCPTASTTARSGSIRLTAFPPTTSACLRSNGLIRNASCSCIRPAIRAHRSTLARRWPRPPRHRSICSRSIAKSPPTSIPRRYAFVVLSDAVALPSIFENALLRYVRGGGSVLIAAGTSAAHHARIPIFGGYSSDAHSYTRDGYATVGQTDLTHAVMNDSGLGRFEDLLRRGCGSGAARV